MPDENDSEEARLDALVIALTGIAEATRLEHTLDVGGAVLRRMFSDDPELFERTWRRNREYRAFIESWHAPPSMSLDTLTRTRLLCVVRVAAQYRRFPSDLQQGFTWAHHAALLRLRDIGDRIELGREALAQGWKPHEIRERIPRDEEKAALRRRLRRLKRRCEGLSRALADDAPDNERTRLTLAWLPIHMTVLRRRMQKIEDMSRPSNTEPVEDSEE